MLTNLLRLLGFGVRAAGFVSDAIRAARDGRARDAAFAIQRAAEVQAFKIRHGWEPSDHDLSVWEDPQ